MFKIADGRFDIDITEEPENPISCKEGHSGAKLGLLRAQMMILKTHSLEEHRTYLCISQREQGHLTVEHDWTTYSILQAYASV